jgi:hypothetical protein
MFVQVPLDPEIAQLWQPFVHASLQHTPSTQWSLLQSVLPWQAWPFASLPPHLNVVWRQVRPVLQWLSFWQSVLQETPSALHMKGSQSWGLAVGQWPAPSQLAAGV